MVLNIRVKRFEVLDSARTFKDKAFLATANKIMEGIKANWEEHYNTSSVPIKDWELQEIKCPKQDNRNKVQDNREDSIQESTAFYLASSSTGYRGCKNRGQDPSHGLQHFCTGGQFLQLGD